MSQINIPAHWSKPLLKEICEIIAGQSPESQYYNEDGEGVPFFQGKTDFGDLYPSLRVYCSKPKKIAERNDILLSVRAPVGPTNLSPGTVCIGRGLTAIRPKPGTSYKYILYFFKLIEKKLTASGTGTTFKAITQDQVKKIEVPLPSLQEQERIVAKIEELFSELDKGVEVLQKTKAQLKVYRQAVLKDAFEGRLTSKWRHSNEFKIETVLRDYNSICIRNAKYKDASGDETQFMLDIPLEWQIVRMGDLFSVQVGSTPSRRIDEYWNGNLHWVSSGEVTFNNITSTRELITQIGLDNSSTNLQPEGTVLLAMIGEGKTRGQAAILRIPAAHNQNTAAILVSQTPCSPQYIYYYLMLNYQYTRRIGSGNNQKALNKERVRAINIPFTSFEEQTIIAYEIEKQMSICDKIEQIVDESLIKAESLRQSILKKAFEGKLV